MDNDPLANMDQLLRAVVDIAKVMRVYYVALIEEGFSNEEALRVTMAYQRTILTPRQEDPE